MPKPPFLLVSWGYTADFGFSVRRPILPKAPVTETRVSALAPKKALSSQNETTAPVTTIIQSCATMFVVPSASFLGDYVGEIWLQRPTDISSWCCLAMMYSKHSGAKQAATPLPLCVPHAENTYFPSALNLRKTAGKNVHDRGHGSRR